MMNWLRLKLFPPSRQTYSTYFINLVFIRFDKFILDIIKIEGLYVKSILRNCPRPTVYVFIISVVDKFFFLISIVLQQ
jgi:hypothetical protein